MKRPIRTKDRKPPKHEDARVTANNFIFGVNPVVEALRSRSRRIDRIAIATNVGMHRMRDILELAHTADLRIDRVPPERIERTVGNDANHQGVVAFVSAAEYSTGDEIVENIGEDALLLLLDGVEDPRNLGAILRTAECAGVDGVFVPERRAAGLTETVAKSAAGATEHLKIAKVTNLNNQIAELKKQNIWVVGTTVDAEMEHTEWDWTRPSALVLGGEGRGLHRLVAENCDVLVKIPMYGKIDSLNVSVAAGVILFEAQRQRAIAERDREKAE